MQYIIYCEFFVIKEKSIISSAKLTMLTIKLGEIIKRDLKR
ncbi:hypothetical protein bcf_25670 [Bacillus cereus F837/76]|nr:hypothetical protein bcf_25670 [Bacillus cereus F837/76]